MFALCTADVPAHLQVDVNLLQLMRSRHSNVWAASEAEEVAEAVRSTRRGERLWVNSLACRQVASVTAFSVKVCNFGAVSNTALWHFRNPDQREVIRKWAMIEHHGQDVYQSFPSSSSLSSSLALSLLISHPSLLFPTLHTSRWLSLLGAGYKYSIKPTALV